MDNQKPIKVIIDTNLWISFLIGKQLASLQPLLIEKTGQPILSEQLLQEIILYNPFVGLIMRYWLCNS